MEGKKNKQGEKDRVIPVVSVVNAKGKQRRRRFRQCGIGEREDLEAVAGNYTHGSRGVRSWVWLAAAAAIIEIPGNLIWALLEERASKADYTRHIYSVCLLRLWELRGWGSGLAVWVMYCSYMLCRSNLCIAVYSWPRACIRTQQLTTIS
jgi:hypothetical protein